MADITVCLLALEGYKMEGEETFHVHIKCSESQKEFKSPPTNKIKENLIEWQDSATADFKVKDLLSANFTISLCRQTKHVIETIGSVNIDTVSLIGKDGVATWYKLSNAKGDLQLQIVTFVINPNEKNIETTLENPYMSNIFTHLIKTNAINKKLDNSPLNCKIVTHTFFETHNDFIDKKDVFNDIKGSRSLIYMYIVGLYNGKIPGNGNQGPKSERRKEAFAKHQLDLRLCPIEVDGSIEDNAAIIASYISHVCKSEKKQIVLIGHSKGGVDAVTAVSLFSDIIPHIRCVITLQSPLLGSPVASDIVDIRATWTVARRFIKYVMKCNPVALQQLTFSSRLDFLAKHPYPHTVPTLCFASTLLNTDSSMQFMYKYIKRYHGDENDGVVRVSDGFLPGSNVIVLEGYDHHLRGVPSPAEVDFELGSTKILLSIVATALKTTKVPDLLHIPTPSIYPQID